MFACKHTTSTFGWHKATRALRYYTSHCVRRIRVAGADYCDMKFAKIASSGFRQKGYIVCIHVREILYWN